MFILTVQWRKRSSSSDANVTDLDMLVSHLRLRRADQQSAVPWCRDAGPPERCRPPWVVVLFGVFRRLWPSEIYSWPLNGSIVRAELGVLPAPNLNIN